MVLRQAMHGPARERRRARFELYWSRWLARFLAGLFPLTMLALMLARERLQRPEQVLAFAGSASLLFVAGFGLSGFLAWRRACRETGSGAEG